MEGLHLDRKFAHFGGNYGERRIGLGECLGFLSFISLAGMGMGSLYIVL